MIESQLRALDETVRSFERAITALAVDDFLEPLGKWTPRDILAHLIGWNRYVIRGSREILRGELPFYDVDPGRDFAKVNAVLIETYPSPDRDELLKELRRSHQELSAFLRSMDVTAWDHDFGVRNHGETITVRSTVDDLIADYAHHRQQLLAG